jgi:deoxyribodipyrimidine photolyase
MKFTFKWVHKCDQDHKAGDEINMSQEIEVPQDKIDAALKERLERKSKQHTEEVDKLKAEYEEKLKTATSAGEGDVAAQIKAAVDEVKKETADKLAEADAKAIRANVIAASKTKLPNIVLAQFQHKVGESEEDATARLAEFLKNAEAELKDSGFNDAPKDQGSSARGSGSDEGKVSREILLADARKYYPAVLASCDSDDEIVRQMQKRVDNGLHVPGKGPAK